MSIHAPLKYVPRADEKDSDRDARPSATSTTDYPAFTEEQYRKWKEIDPNWGDPGICPVCQACYCAGCHDTGPCMKSEESEDGEF